MFFGIFSKAQEPVEPQTLSDISGVYECEGTIAEGKTYKGFVQIFKTGDTYFLFWMIGSDVQYGTGFVRDGKLSVGFVGPSNGVVVYRLESDSRLVGEWTFFSNSPDGIYIDGMIRTEVLTRTSKPMPNSSPEPEPKSRPEPKPSDKPLPRQIA